MPLLFSGNHRSSSHSGDEIPVRDLKTSSPEGPDEVQYLKYVNGSPSQLEQDNRTSVNRMDILPGGKYRGIAKLFQRFENCEPDTWVIATGFCVRDDLVSTAGHSVYDWEYELGELTEAKVYLGYTGKQNIDNPEVEVPLRQAICHDPEWMEKGNRREANLAFIKLNKPFREVSPYDYRDTPESDMMNTGVVSYAGDLRKNAPLPKSSSTSSQHPAGRLDRLQLCPGAHPPPFLDELKNGGKRSGRSASIPSLRQSRGRGLSGRKAQFVDALSEGARNERTERFVNIIASDDLSDYPKVRWENLNISKRLQSTSSIIGAGKQQPSMVGPLLVSKGQKQQHGHGLHPQQQITLHNLHELMEMDLQDDEFPLSIECLPLRTVVAEAALQAILRVQQQDLEDEGLFDTMHGVIRKHGPIVVKIAPALIRKVAPVFTAIATQYEEYAVEKGRGEYGYAGKHAFKYASRARGKSPTVPPH
ncbi:hypothetical protein BDW66DRAFT_153180 [Aspergillus desertorum]